MSSVTFIIFGMTGDLARRKLIPAIYRLVQLGKLTHFAIVGVARSQATAKQILAGAREFIPKVDSKIWKQMEEATYYRPFDAYDETQYAGLGLMLEQVERKHQLSGNRVFYLATLPEHFEAITQALVQSKIAVEHPGTWCRVIYEKPFGRDLKSAKSINRAISRVFDERQIFRIDHYLGKELVENIALMRFTNRVLEPLWNRKHVESVQIILSESLGLEGRGGYYDQYGAVKDVVQNHLLQLLALVAMEAPDKLTGEYVREQKAKVLRKVRAAEVLLGQYDGYHHEKNVAAGSTTETFAALKVFVNNKRWQGVPFFLKTGKKLAKKEVLLVLKFRMVECLLTESCPSDSNYLIIRIAPEEGFTLELNAKAPEKPNQVIPVKMEFCHSCLYGPKTPQAYEKLLEDVLNGEQAVFVRKDEIEYSWKVVDAVARKKLPVHPYEPGSAGPKELAEWSRKHKVRWRR